MRFTYFLLFFLFITLVKIFPQACCTVGTSVSGGIERGVVPFNKLSLAFSFQNNVLDETYNGTDMIDDPLNRKSTVTDFILELEYGLVETVSLLINAGYTSKSRSTDFIDSETNRTQEITFKGKGFTDIVILGKYEIIQPNIIAPLALTVGGGAKLPTGSYQLDENGTRLSIDLQPGTGATDLLLWAHSSYKIPSASLGFNINALYRYTGTNLDAYRFGDELLISLNSAYSIVGFLALNLQIKGRFADEDYWNGRFLPSTGGTYIDLTPSLIYLEGELTLRIAAQFPLYRNVDGIQLVVSEKISAELRYLFDLN